MVELTNKPAARKAAKAPRPSGLDGFVALSETLTGFNRYDLRATGMAELYLTTVERQIGADAYQRLFVAWHSTHDVTKLHPTYIEVARAIAYLWYTGAWPRLAPAAHAALRRQVANAEFVVSPTAYPEGLVWRTFHGHPVGAKPPGFGTWSMRPPDVPGVDGIFEELAVDAADVPPAFTDALTVSTIDASALPGPAPEYYVVPAAPEVPS